MPSKKKATDETTLRLDSSFQLLLKVYSPDSVSFSSYVLLLLDSLVESGLGTAISGGVIADGGALAPLLVG